MKDLNELSKFNKLDELDSQDIEPFIDENIKKLISFIKLDANDWIFVNRKMSSEGGFPVFLHKIYICPAEQLIGSDIWEDSEMFEKNGNNLYLYLKGRMLIQTTTTWEIYKVDPFVKYFKLICNYRVKED